MAISSSLTTKKKTGFTGLTDETKNKLSQYESGYKQSDKVNQAYTTLQQIQQNKPGTYSSKYTDQLNSLYDQIMNRPDFKYDLASDALYQQYKDQYQQQGKLAMMDTMGQASALTGGYGSSYASSVGNQAYQSYLSQINDKVPELYQMAYQKYMNEGDELKNKYSVTQDADTVDYGKYRDTVSDYYNNLNFASDTYNNERNFDYNDYSNMLSYYQGKAGQEQDQYNWQQSYDYQAAQDALAQQNWQKEFDYQKAQDARNYALSVAKMSSSGSSSGGTKKTNAEIDKEKRAQDKKISQWTSYAKNIYDKQGIYAFVNYLDRSGLSEADQDEIIEKLGLESAIKKAAMGKQQYKGSSQGNITNKYSMITK